MKSTNQHRAYCFGLTVGVIALALLYHFVGVSVWAGTSPSLFRWLYANWSSESMDAAVDYSHGIVIPFVSLWLLWRKRAALKEVLAAPRPHAFGIVLWALAILMHFVGLRAQLAHLSAISLIVALWGLVWTFVGAAAAKLTLFPFAFLLFAVPIGFLAQATFPLRLFGSLTATGILNGIGIETMRRGTAVFSTAGEGFALDVADPCSGIRSLMTLMALAAGYAYVFKTRWFERWFLFAMSLPIAVVANIGRIVGIAIVARFLGQDTGMKIYHDYSGYLVFILAVLLVMGVDRAMDRAKAGWMRLRRAGDGPIDPS